MDLDVDCIHGEPEEYTCRVCLSTNTKLYHLVGCGLQNDFHNITGIQVSSDDELPQYICYVCRELLRKAASFRNKSISTHNILSLRQVPMDHDQIMVTTPLVSFIQMDTLLISIPPVAPAEEVDTTNTVDASLVKEEKDQKPEHEVNIKHKDKFKDTETFVKAEANENSFNDGTDYDMDVEAFSNLNNESDEQEVVKVVNVSEILDGKAKPKQRSKPNRNKKFPDPPKGDPEMDAESVKDYLLRTNTHNVYAKMLNKYIISKYIDETKEFNSNIDKENDELIDSEDEFTSLNELIKVEDDSAEINNILNSQTNMEPSKKILYEFMKERYMEKKKPAKKRRSRDLVRIKFKTDRRVLQTQKTMEELKKECNVEIKMLSFEEQIAEMKKRMQVYENSAFQCKECFRGFQFERTYNYHMRSHDPTISGNIKCEVCNKRFINRGKLLKHQLVHKYRFVCKACDCVSRSPHVAREHAKSHSGQNSYKCEHCCRVFRKAASRTNHIRIKHGSVECEICYDLMAPAGLIMHNILRHKETFRCQSCDKVFNDADALAIHKSFSIKGVCDSNGRTCTMCGEIFTSESKWTTHIQEHRVARKRRARGKYLPSNRSDNADAKPATPRARVSKLCDLEPGKGVMCEMCGDMFINKAVMLQHQRTHTGEKPFACTYCPKRFRLKCLLQMHINTHTGERPHKCQRCPKSFKCRTALYRHQLVHTQERRHRCTYCEKSFQTSTSVKLHIKTVHLKMPMPPRVRNRKKRAE